MLGLLQDAREDYVAAGKARKEAEAVLEKLYGADHWRAVDARWERVTTERLAKLGSAWKVLDIEYKDDNKVSLFRPNKKKIARLIEQFNR